jgi:hypothetical protein
MLRRTARLLGLLLALGVIAPLLFAADASPGEDEAGGRSERRVLERLRADREHYDRLRRDLKAFLALPPQRQEQLRRLDRELHEQDSATQKHLLQVLDRYASWLERLPESQRRQIESTTDRAERLKLIRQLREQEWLERLPYKVREELLALPEEKRPEAIARVREEERQRQLAWQRTLRLRAAAASRPGKPAALADFPPEVIAFVEDVLKPMLSPAELKRLDDADGQWPLLPLTILELSDKHPVLPPPVGMATVTAMKDLPPRDKPLLKNHDLKAKQGRWPDFALAVHEIARKEGVTLSRPLGACRPTEFKDEVQVFLRDVLPQAVTPAELKRLRELEGKWPEYPRYLHELARKHGLSIPGLTLPGPKEIWENARSALPDVPDAVLRRFALAELTPQDLTALQISPMDPTASRDKLKQEFFRRHPSRVSQFRKPGSGLLSAP